MLKNKQLRKKGFTLTEILVVVLIIGVLAAVVYPLYTKAITKSRAVEAINLLEMVRNKQIQKYARDSEYFSEFSSMGRLTGNKSEEAPVGGGAQLQIKQYTLSLNNATKCMSAAYAKGSSNFKFSTSYENAGLGCTGSICTSFGDIIGDASSVCNCGSKSCNNGFELNDDTCNCDCHMQCNQGGRCYNKTQSYATSQNCGRENSGKQTRVCTANCDGGQCEGWGACTGQTCDESSGAKPSVSSGCGNCGTMARSVTCDGNSGTWKTGTWGSCTGQGSCSPGATQSCGNNKTGTQTCSGSCGWGSCTGERFDCSGSSSESCGNCGTRNRTCNTTNGTWGDWGSCQGEGSCSPGSTSGCGSGGTITCTGSCSWGGCTGETFECSGSSSQGCGNCGTQTRTCNTSNGTWNSWDTCQGEGCRPGEVASCGTNGNKTCTSSCSWGSCIEAPKDCNASLKPATSEGCGNCGTRTRSVTCNDGTWETGGWGACSGEGVCSPGATGSTSCPSGYSGTQTRTCSSGCVWGSWSSAGCKENTCTNTCSNGQEQYPYPNCGCYCPSDTVEYQGYCSNTCYCSVAYGYTPDQFPPACPTSQCERFGCFGPNPDNLLCTGGIVRYVEP